MDLSWIILIIGTVFIAGYILYSASEERIEALENRVRQVEKLLKQKTRGMELAEPDINEELLKLLQKGKTVEAVKRTRQEFGWSLLEAKQYVDELKEGK